MVGALAVCSVKPDMVHACAHSAKQEAEERYRHHHHAWQEFEGNHGPKEAELNRLQQEIEAHNRCCLFVLGWGMSGI